MFQSYMTLMKDLNLKKTINNQVCTTADVFLLDPFKWNILCFNSLSANPTKWSNTLKQFDHFVILALKGLTTQWIEWSPTEQ